MRFGIWENTIKRVLQEVGAETGLIGLRNGTGGGACECGNEPSSSINFGWEFKL
jgi:hypothetical protein